MKKSIIIVLIVLSFLSLQGQNNKDTAYQLPKIWSIGIKANIGASMIVESYNPSPYFTYNNKFLVGFNGGFSFNNILNENENFCFEILFLQMNGIFQHNETFSDSAGKPLGSLTTTDNIHLSYISIPMYYRYTFSKLSIGIGAQVSYLFISNDDLKYSETVNGQSPFDTTFISKNLAIAKFDYGPKLILFYQLTDKLSLNLDYYYGLQNLINDGNTTGESERNQQLSLGLIYKLY